MKRILDCLVSVLGLLFLLPLLLILSVAIALPDRGSIFYRAKRIGRGGIPFELYKFRTMVVDADRIGPAITTRGDSRVTPIGRFLRRTKLDELPQLLNVLKGDMSLVGPRPEDPRYVTLYTPEQCHILDYAPGITSAASLFYRDEEQMLTGDDWETVYRTKVMPEKIEIDLEYMVSANILTDLNLIFQTVLAMVPKDVDACPVRLKSD
ncbi:MAG: UDP-glucose:undecaprenyl-phosphate glucose-phosphate transferase [Cyanobacteriota bacterium]|jgi:lipopolysaccharide/colanic/teichoic acid biosynthesis glycosyltransferase